MQTVEDRRSTNQQTESAIYGDNFAEVWEKSIFDPASLALSEIRIMDAYFAIGLEQAFRVYELESAGLEESGATVQHMQLNFSFLFSNAFAKVWWEQEGSTWR